MATQEVTASLIVRFGGLSASAGDLQIEIDGREDGFNNGKTSFVGGDSPAFLIFKTDDIVINEIIPSAGRVDFLADQDIVLKEEKIFAQVAQASTAKPMKGAQLDSFKWIGTDLGTPQPLDQKTLQIAAEGVGVLFIDYTTTAQAFRLNNVPFPLNGEIEFPVVVFVRGTQIT